jgi:hypothetical protein
VNAAEKVSGRALSCGRDLGFLLEAFQARQFKKRTLFGFDDGGFCLRKRPLG